MTCIRSAVLAMLLFTPAIPARSEEKPNEAQKIEALLTHVKELKDAKFVRNDKEYDSETAARFLRGKWQARQDQVQTAQDFIENIASVSSTTGKPYLIRFKDGSEVKCGDYLTDVLKQLEDSQASVLTANLF